MENININKEEEQLLEHFFGVRQLVVWGLWGWVWVWVCAS